MAVEGVKILYFYQRQTALSRSGTCEQSFYTNSVGPMVQNTLTSTGNSALSSRKGWRLAQWEQNGKNKREHSWIPATWPSSTVIQWRFVLESTATPGHPWLGRKYDDLKNLSNRKNVSSAPTCAVALRKRLERVHTGSDFGGHPVKTVVQPNFLAKALLYPLNLL